MVAVEMTIRVDDTTATHGTVSTDPIVGAWHPAIIGSVSDRVTHCGVLRTRSVSASPAIR
jgi:hypothetical protein